LYSYNSALNDPQSWIQDQHKIFDKRLEEARKQFDKKEYKDYEKNYVNNITLFVLNELFKEGEFDRHCFIISDKNESSSDLAVKQLIKTALEYVKNKENIQKYKKYLASGGFIFEDIDNE